MRQPFARAVVAAVVFCSLPACRREPVAVKTIEEAPRLPSAVLAGEPQAASQWAAGFYQIEDGAWRWTGRQFAVVLGTPPGAAQRGATLSLRVTVPPVVIQKLTATTLSASINGSELAPETYTKAGDYTYQREIAPSVLAADSARINFHLDRAIPPSGGDARELGIIVLRASLEGT